ncbi:MAG: bifunctional glutamate N-acetyltransferase/amino-acid acetyltransferase ArgJ [Dehalococcoidia bacterium]|nr:bifunctional glutamate N-acetyltransferase/amino-acid acetyltransferase ArgJ [Dehalococcoidia bacterium]
MTSSSKLVSQGTITTPRGFLAGVTYAGIKKPDVDALDLGILYSEVPCVAAGVFTTNRIKAASVILCQRHLENNKAQAIVVNSGCANACTGEEGLVDAEEVAAITAKKLGLPPREVLVASTGVIGTPLPMGLIRSSIEKIIVSRENGHDLAKAITTTDRFPKETAVQVVLGHREGEIAIGGIAKGSGMIHPDLATFLCFLTTDAAVEPGFLKGALRKAADVSFNMITIDGDTSPNDSVIILANGLAGNEMIESGSPGAAEFEEALETACLSLAKSIARDGEGATKLIEVTVEGALTISDARQGARVVSGSSLVKAAVHGSDPNWGRIIAAMGRSGTEMVESKTDLYIDNLCVMKAGRPHPFDRAQAKSVLDKAEVPIRVCLNLGDATATAWGCDLSEEYVTINSEYTT